MVYIVTIITILGYGWLAGLAFKQWKRNAAIRRFALLFLASTMWFIVVLCESILRNDHRLTVTLLDILSRIDWALAAIVSFFIASFALHFPSSNRAFSKSKEAAFSLPIIVLVILSFAGYLHTIGPGEVKIGSDARYLVYISILTVYFVAIAFSVLIRKFRTSTGIQKLQLQYFFLGYGISIIGLLLNSVYSYFYTPNPTVDLYWVNIAFVFIGFSSYTILRYRLLNIDKVLRRGAVYTITLIPLLLIYTYLIFLAQSSLSDRTGINQETSFFLAVLIISLSFLPLYRFVRKIIKPLFYKKEEDPAWLEKKLNEATKSSLTFESLIRRMKFYLESILEYRDFAIFVLDKERNAFTARNGKGEPFAIGSHLVALLTRRRKPLVRDEIPFRIEEVSRVDAEQLRQVEQEMRERGIALALPMGQDDDLNGIITFPEKPKKEAFDREEIEHLEEFQREAGSALDSTILYYEAIERVRRQVRGEG